MIVDLGAVLLTAGVVIVGVLSIAGTIALAIATIISLYYAYFMIASALGSRTVSSHHAGQPNIHKEQCSADGR